MKSVFEKMGGTYRQEGDYLLPNLSLPPDTEQYPLGKYGRMRKQYDDRWDALETSCRNRPFL